MAADNGGSAHCFRARIYGEKSYPCTIDLHRSNKLKSRYTISEKLRRIVPHLRPDPTEEELLLAVWEYIAYHDLLNASGTDKKDKR